MGRLEAPTDDEEGDFETGELVAAHGEMDGARAFDALAAEEGGRLLRRRTLKGLQMVVSTYRFESNAALRVAFRKLAPGFQGLALDRNSHFGSLGPSAADQRKRNAALKWSDSLASCSEKLRIGMLDTGILNTHTALLGRSIRQHSFLPAGAEPSDLDHGTAIATILLGGRGAEEFAGLLPEAELFAGAVFRRRGNKAVTTAEALALGLDWLVTERVSAVNLSLGGSFNKLVEAALQKVIGLDIAVVAAAGADDANDKPLYPAYMPGVVAVTAVDGNWESARDHPRGSYISFAAPGIDVWAGNAEGGGSYVSGSSYAAPFVTAAIAAAGSNGYATLSRGARDLGAPGRDPVYGWGLIQFAPGCSGGSER